NSTRLCECSTSLRTSVFVVSRPVVFLLSLRGENTYSKHKTNEGATIMQNQRQTADIPKWSALLVEAVNKPGLIMKAYSNFHSYSLGNQLLALVQCQMRGLQPGPI